MATERFGNERYISWLKLGLSLNFAKEGLEKFTDDGVNTFHNKLKSSLPDSIDLGGHSCNDKISLRKQWQKGKFSCQSDNCDKWLSEIRTFHKNPSTPVEWDNADLSQLSTQPWECAKLFMPYGCQKHTCAKDADIAALLTLYLKCNHFNTLFSNVDDCQQVKDIRNRLMHSGSMEVDTLTMHRDTAVIINFLEDPQHLLHDQNCKDAVSKIKELLSGKMELSLNKELELRLLHTKLRSLDDVVDHLHNSYTDLSSRVKNLSTDAITGAEELKQLKSENTKINVEFNTTRQDLSEVKSQIEVFSNFVSNNKIDAVSTQKLSEMNGKICSLDNEMASSKKLLLDLSDSVSQLELKLIEHAHELNQLKEEQMGHKRKMDELGNIIKSKKKREIYSEHDIKGIQTKIIGFYERNCQRVPIYPLRPTWTKRIEDLYAKPSMIVEDPRGISAKHAIHDRGLASRDQEVEVKIDKIKEIFYSEGKLCKDVYIKAEMGMGKTSLCEHLVALWVRGQTGPRPLSEDESDMRLFTFLFYISLREANRSYKDCHHLENIIISQLQLTDCDVSKLISEYTCLIILDGLDELTQKYEPGSLRFGSKNLPERTFSDQSIYLTTSRPFKLELLARDLEGKIDRQIKIVGLDQTSQKGLANNVITLLNSEYGTKKSADKFIFEMNKQNLNKCLGTPVLLMQMLGLWFDEKPLGDSQCDIYSNLIEKQIQFTEKVRGLTIEENQQSSVSQDQLPGCFKNQQLCQKYKSVLFKVSKLAYERIFDKNQENSLIFDHEQTEVCGMTDDEVIQLLHMGILTQHKVFGGVTEELKSVQFLHKSHQEFFCAIYLCAKCQRSELSQLFSEVICNLDRVIELEQIFLFVCGLNIDVATELSEYITEKVSSDSMVQEYRHLLGYDPRLSALIERIQEIIVAGAAEARKNDQSTTTLKIADLHIVSVWYDDSRNERVFACDTSHTKSISMETTGNLTSWPSSPYVEKIYLYGVGITACYAFKNNFSADRLSVLNLYEVAMTHEQLDCLLRGLSLTGNLTKVFIHELSCITHKYTEDDCNIQLDFSRHKRLETLRLHNLGVEKIGCVRLCQEMENLKVFGLGGMRFSAAVFRETIQTLPGNGTVTYGDDEDPVKVTGADEARQVLDQIIRSPGTIVVENSVEYNLREDECTIHWLTFYNTK